MRRGRRLVACLVLCWALGPGMLGSSIEGAQAESAQAETFSGVHRACHPPRPGRAACLAMQLLPASRELQAGTPAQSPGAAAGASPAVSVKEPYPGYLTPQRLHEAYALPRETDAAHVQSVAVVDAFDDPTAEADLDVYDKQFGLSPCTTANGCFRKLNQLGDPSPLPKKQGEWASEISIDVQMVRAICQSCRILLVEASSEEFGDLGEAVDAAVAAGADEVSNSYGGGEEPSDPMLASAYYEHPGTAIFASSGDCGYLSNACPGEPGIAEFPASSPYAIAVGGTSLTEHNKTWSSTVWREGGSGCSQLFSAAPWQGAAANFSATGCGSGRSVADLAAIGDPDTGVDVYDSTPETSGSSTGWGVWGGTSVAAPIVAAELALSGGSRGVAYPAATLYEHLGEADALYDVSSGKNGSCAGTTECQAVPGFDGPTGIGSPLGLAAFSISGTPVSTTPPTIAGAAEQGQTLRMTSGSWTDSPSSLSEQWARCNDAGYGCSPIPGATDSSYEVTAADGGSTIRVQEIAENEVGQGAPAASTASATVPAVVPAITGLAPRKGITGSTLTIEGSALEGVSEVRFGQLAADFTVPSATQIEAIVPNGAKPGKVSVIAPAGIASSPVRFTPTLSITGFLPKHGSPGRLVTIKGIGFLPSSRVAFAGTKVGEVTFVSSRKLEAVVPAAAQSGPITVTNNAAPVGTVQSAASFQVP